ncbi:ATP-binding protein [Microlunatus parietis]|uniref:AAA domain-containing protein n=1 Tax=Microlunatus parietis TaxID=682979 RepID=A0A7Y9I3H9_9ACTN|nr:hypothetical protein [Microlunatus parietis]NYE69259.1 hypothetical protein [Microlunatus parietis]
MIGYVLGAPGSGKTTLIPHLRPRLPGWTVLDGDALMPDAERLAGAPIASTPATWPAYEGLLRTVIELVLPNPVLLLWVCTPEELQGWPGGPWLLLDCADAERQARLASRDDPAVIMEGVTDAAAYRKLGLPRVDSTERDPGDVAAEVVHKITSAAVPRR